MDNNLQHILDKLRKLMDLKESATQCGELGEAHAAAAGITRLLKEYDLTLQDIPDEKKQQDPVDMEAVPFSFPYIQHKWYWVLLDVLAKHNSCQIIRSRQMLGNKTVDCTYSVIGRKQHRQVVMYLISFCAHQFIQIGKRKYAVWKYDFICSTGKTPPPMGTYMKSFLLGCVDGLNDKLAQQQNDLPQDKLGALVLANKKALDDFLKNMEVNRARKRAIKVDGSILEEGREVGRNINLQKGIEGKVEKPFFLQ